MIITFDLLGHFVAVNPATLEQSGYTFEELKALPNSIDRWLPRRLHSLGTDGFGRSEGRKSLREFFEVDARFVALAALSELAREGAIDWQVVRQAIRQFDIDPEKPNPARV